MRPASFVCGEEPSARLLFSAPGWRKRALAVLVPAVLLTCATAGAASAGSRDWGYADRAREQAQRAAERAREQAQQAAERAREQARRAAQQDDDRNDDRQSGFTRARDSDSGQDRRGNRDDDDSDKPTGKRGPVARDDRKRDRDDQGPPETVLEMIKRIAAPAKKDAPPEAPPKAPPSAPGPAAARPAPPKARIAPLGPPPPLASPEVLAVGLSPASLARARDLGFRIGASTSFGQLNTKVTRLVAPDGLDPLNARNLLASELPNDNFGLNYQYRPYHSATGDKDGRPDRMPGVRKAATGGCDRERCYGPSIIGWDADMRSCAKNVRIGVIDTSVDRSHPTFEGRNVQVRNFTPAGTAPSVSWHGTGVLAVMAGSPNSGTPGLLPDAQFFAADVYHSDERGQPVADTMSVLRALEWMSASKVRVVNMSMSGPFDEVIKKAIADMSAKGMLFVAAAGNGGPNAPPSYPAAYDEVIAVTAVGKDLRGYMYANHGDYIDVAAPGVGIWTALPDVLEGYQSGTSFAAPHVTAILAALQDQVRDKSKEGFLRALAVRDLGPAGRDRIYGRGLVMAPTFCSPGEGPGGWYTNIVRAPAAPLPALSSGLTAQSGRYK